MTSTAKKFGDAGEDAAADFLRANGFTVIARNFRAPGGEIDIIADDGATLVFVEVKARSGKKFGRPCEAVDFRKRQKIIAAANYWLMRENIFEKHCRFDVIEVYKTDDGFEILPIVGAFEA